MKKIKSVELAKEFVTANIKIPIGKPLFLAECSEEMKAALKEIIERGTL